jgi:sugar phosphate isomerase/epimerase
VATDRIAVSTWSFHTFYERDKNDPAKVLWDVGEFPEMIADRYGVHNIEVVLPHLGGTEPSRLSDVKARVAKARSRIVNMPLDYGELWNKPSISSADVAEREHALGLYKKGIDAAAALGCPTVRADPGAVNLEDPSITIESYKQLAAYARAKGIALVVENHGDIARNPDVLVTILQRAGVGALPDIGNFPDDATRERGLKLMFPIAGNVAHAKMRDGMDFARCVRIANEAGFTGVWSVEASGRTDPHVEVQDIVDALIQHL